MPAERRKAAQAAHDTLTAGSSKRAERPPPAEKKIKFSEFEGQVSALDITIAGKSITEQLKLKAEPKAFTKQSYGFGASGKVKIPVKVTTKEGEEQKEYTATVTINITVDGTKPAPKPKAAKSESDDEIEADA